MDFEIPMGDEQLFDYAAERAAVEECIATLSPLAKWGGLEQEHTLAVEQAIYLLRCYIDTLEEAEEEEGR